MTERQQQLQRAASARILARASELMVAFPDAPVALCLHEAAVEEDFINGSPTAIENPVGLLGWSPTEQIRKRS